MTVLEAVTPGVGTGPGSARFVAAGTAPGEKFDGCAEIDPGIYHRLVIEQKWTPGRYQDWLTDALISLLIPASYQPAS